MKSNKNVLIIISHLSVGGTEIQTLNTVKALVKAHYIVTVWCLYRNLNTVVKEFSDAGAKVIISSPHYNNADIRIKYHKNFQLIKFIYIELQKILKSGHYDIIHVQYITPASTIILILHYIFRHKNIIATAHTSGDIYKRLTIPRFINQHCLKAFQCITLKAEESFFGVSQLFSKTIKLEETGTHFTIYNCLPEHITINTKKEHNPIITVGVVSRLERIKGMDLVVPAFAKVVTEYPNCRLLIVGDGSQRQLMESQAHYAGLTDCIEFVGRQEYETIQNYYDRIDILLMPSRSEGFGLTAIEGMARGCVVVAADTGGLPEVVKDGEVGLLHKYEDVQDIADKVNKLLSNPEKMSLMSRKAIERVSLFSTDRYRLLIKDLYNKLL